MRSAERLDDRTRSSVTRLGGDEFAMLLRECKSVESTTHVADGIQKELMKPFSLGGHEVIITASIGIAISVAYEKEDENIQK